MIYNGIKNYGEHLEIVARAKMLYMKYLISLQIADVRKYGLKDSLLVVGAGLLGFIIPIPFMSPLLATNTMNKIRKRREDREKNIEDILLD